LHALIGAKKPMEEVLKTAVAIDDELETIVMWLAHYEDQIRVKFSYYFSYYFILFHLVHEKTC